MALYAAEEMNVWFDEEKTNSPLAFDAGPNPQQSKNEIEERIAYLKEELKEHPEEAYMVQAPSDIIPKEEIDKISKEIEQFHK